MHLASDLANFRKKFPIGLVWSICGRSSAAKNNKNYAFAVEMLYNDGINPNTNHRQLSRRLTCEFDKKITTSRTF